MNTMSYRIILSLLLFISNLAFADVYVGKSGDGGKTSGGAKVLNDCARSTSRSILEINNIRTTLHNGGDMWWTVVNPGAPRYEVPKQDDPSAPKQHSLFAGSIWIGGEDAANDELLVLASTYRQSHYALWPGPLFASGDA